MYNLNVLVFLLPVSLTQSWFLCLLFTIGMLPSVARYCVSCSHIGHLSQFILKWLRNPPSGSAIGCSPMLLLIFHIGNR